MAKGAVYYFSGSGNSFYTAKQIAKNINAEVLRVRILGNSDKINPEYKTLGFVFPVYDFKPPEYVIKCIKNLLIQGDAYVFCVASYGLSAGKAIDFFRSSLELNGIVLFAGYLIAMPHNGICSGLVSEKHIQKLLHSSEAKIKEISGKIKRKEHFIESNHFIPVEILKAGIIRMFPGLLKFIYILITRGIGAMALSVDSSCNGCGFCSRICPVNNIKMVDNMPVWNDRCAGCFGCLHWCPEKSISPGGYDMNIKHYHHPGVKAGELS